jgi:hypothetical protein
VFRNDYPQETMNVTLSGFPDGKFVLCDMISGKEIETCSGHDLRSGLKINWDQEIPCRALSVKPLP